MSSKMLVCRACMQELNVDNIKRENDFQSLKPIYTELTLLHVSEDDSLPKHLCTMCSDKLLLFKVFKDTCIDSDLHLRSKLVQIKEEIFDYMIPQSILKIEPLALSENDNSDFDSNDRNFETEPRETRKTTRKSANDVVKTQKKRKAKTEAKVDTKENIKSKVKRKEKKTDQPIMTLFCAKCGAECKSKLAMKKHLEKHYGPPPPKTNSWKNYFKCTEPGCRTTFKKQDDFEGHVQCHKMGIPVTVCDICLKPLAHERSKHLHRREVHGNVTYKCTFCTKVLVNLESYQSHVKRHENPPKYDFMCDICGKAFNHRATLKAHKFSHSGEKNFKCDQCPKAYTTIQSLLGHKHIHSNKVYVCLICGQEFQLQRRLFKHCKYHHTVYSTMEPVLLTCKICNGKFKNEKTLKTHEKLHRGERPYACQLCPQTYAHSHLLKRHSYTHTGELPYHCEFCGKGFIKSCNFKNHKKTHLK